MDKPNFAAMTPEQRRDWLAEQEGWKRRGDRWRHPVYHKLGSGQKRHPLPNTLDAAAEAMPKGYMWGLYVNYKMSPAQCFATGATVSFASHLTGMGENPTDALFHLACECVWAEMNTTNSL